MAASRKTTSDKKPASGKKAAAGKQATPTAGKRSGGSPTGAKRQSSTESGPAAATASTKKSAARGTGAAAKKTAARRSAQASPAAGRSATTRVRTAGKPTGRARARARDLKVRRDEDPWTPQELDEVRSDLQAEVDRLTGELTGIESQILGLMIDGGDGAGDDQADVGAKTFEREHEFSLAQNSRDLLLQSQHALERIEDGTYGTCENCGNPIGKARLQAFPRATLCVTCKQQAERTR